MDRNAPSRGLPEKLGLQQLSLSLTEHPYVQSKDANWSIEPRVIRDYDLFICTGGRARFTVQGEEFLLSAQNALLIPPDTLFSAAFVGPDHFDAMAQHFTLEILGGSDLFSLIEHRIFVDFGKEWSTIETTMDRYVANAAAPPFVREAIFLELLHRFLARSWISDRPPANDTNLFVVEIAHLIEQRYAEANVLSEAAELSPLSWDYSSRLFKDYMGVTPKQYLLRRRVNIARSMLQAGYSVKETAWSAGFRDELYFSRLFKRRTGVPPSEYRYGV